MSEKMREDVSEKSCRITEHTLPNNDISAQCDNCDHAWIRCMYDMSFNYCPYCGAKAVK